MRRRTRDEIPAYVASCRAASRGGSGASVLLSDGEGLNGLAGGRQAKNAPNVARRCAAPLPNLPPAYRGQEKQVAGSRSVPLACLATVSSREPVVRNEQLIQQALRPFGRARSQTRTRLLLCGSALTVMGKLLSGTAPLRGRAGRSAGWTAR